MNKTVVVVIIAIAFLILATTIHAASLTVTGTVPPHYEVTPVGNTLFIETNMQLNINGKYQ